MSAIAEPYESVPRRRMALVLAASSAGTVFEWYDFFIFGTLTSIIAKHFFAGVSETQGVILALLTFAAGFVARPFGALVFGHIGDRVGRKRAFLFTITLMGLATFAVAFLPDYQAIGVAAPYLLVTVRVLQGFAIGGEYGGAAIYVAEHASPTRRGAATGWIQTAAGIGLFLALLVILVTRQWMGEATFSEWGWRIPFALSLLLLLVSLWIRLRLDESPVFQRIKEAGEASPAPLAESFLRWDNLKVVIVVLTGFMMGQGVVWYTAQFYTQVFLERSLQVDPVTVNQLIMAVTVASVPLYYFFAWVSDKVGRKPVMLFGLVLSLIAFFPGFRMLAEAANPELAAAVRSAPVSVLADPQDCSFQFDLIGKAKFITSCDIARNALANLGISYTNKAGAAGEPARVQIGSTSVTSFNGHALSATDLAAARTKFQAVLKTALTANGYPTAADPAKLNFIGVFAILLLFIFAATALYGPQAAALVELFPARIRYTALSLPYHIGAGWFGGFLPATSFAIVAATGDIYAGLWYPFIVTAICIVVSLLFLPETKSRDINL